MRLSSMMSRVHKATPHEEEIKALLNTYSCRKPNATPQNTENIVFSIFLSIAHKAYFRQSSDGYE